MAYAHHPPPPPHHHLDYTSIQESITSICKNILPFPFKKRKGLPPSDLQLAKLQLENLKWQQDSFHQIHRLMGLHKEGILSESQVSSFRSHLIDTLIASTSPLHQDHTPILRDKLRFLKELYLAKCIGEDEYHCSKRPLLQRLATLGAEIQASDVIVGTQKKMEVSAEEEWSDIELRDENVMPEDISSNKMKNRSALKQIKGAASSVLNRVATSTYNAGSKRQWGFKKSKRSKEDDQRASVRNCDEEAFVGSCVLVSDPVGGGPDTQQMKRKLHPHGSSSDFFIDKVLGDRVRKQLSRIQSELNTSIQLTNDDIETVSTKLPVDTDDLKRLFAKPWCDKYGNVVLDVVRTEFKDHMADMTRVKKGRRPTAYENDENHHPKYQQ
ncbi:hypothetical protein QQ045_002897 [Rhodiola kirilowii]